MEIENFLYSYWDGYQFVAVHSKQRIGYVTFL